MAYRVLKSFTGLPHENARWGDPHCIRPHVYDRDFNILGPMIIEVSEIRAKELMEKKIIAPVEQAVTPDRGPVLHPGVLASAGVSLSTTEGLQEVASAFPPGTLTIETPESTPEQPLAGQESAGTGRRGRR